MGSDEFLNCFSNFCDDGSWIPLYQGSEELSSSNVTQVFYSYLVPKDKTKDLMTKSTWDLRIGEGKPSIFYDEKSGHYESNDEILPLVFIRQFEGNRRCYQEILQELVLYLNLYHDCENCKYVLDDENGEEIEVIRYNKLKTEIRKDFLMMFMSAKQFDLIICFEQDQHYKNGINLLEADRDVKESHLVYTMWSDQSYIKGFTLLVRTSGKKLILCRPRNKKNCTPLLIERKYADFIISGDRYKSRSYSCDPSKLSNNFDITEDGVHYLTPIFFEKRVLDRYYNAHSEYRVSDSEVKKNNYWRLRIDNNSSECVAVFLGDLGRDLTYKEQEYWRAHNIPPKEKEMSHTFIQRNIRGRYIDPENPALQFQSAFKKFQTEWFKSHEWYIFTPLEVGDLHCIDTLHSLSKNEISEFEQQIKYLSKVLNDSINKQCLLKYLELTEADAKKKLGIDNKQKVGGLKILELFISKIGLNKELIAPLDNIQNIRSKEVVHRKKADYANESGKYNVDTKDYPKTLDIFFKEITKLLDSILIRTKKS